MAKRSEPFWVSILSNELYRNHPPNLSFNIPRRRVIEARAAIEAQIILLKTTLKDLPVVAQLKSDILDAHRETLAHEYVRNYRERIQSATGLNEVQAPPAELSPEEVLDKIKAFIKTRITTQQGPRRHNEVTFSDSAISLLSEFYLNAHPNLDLQQIGMQKGSVIDFLAFIEKALVGGMVTISQIMSLTGYSTQGTTIERISSLKKGTHPQFKLGNSYVINGNSKGWTLERIESDLSY